MGRAEAVVASGNLLGEDAEMTATDVVIGMLVARWIGLIIQACLPVDNQAA